MDQVMNQAPGGVGGLHEDQVTPVAIAAGADRGDSRCGMEAAPPVTRNHPDQSAGSRVQHVDRLLRRGQGKDKIARRRDSRDPSASQPSRHSGTPPRRARFLTARPPVKTKEPMTRPRRGIISRVRAGARLAISRIKRTSLRVMRKNPRIAYFHRRRPTDQPRDIIAGKQVRIHAEARQLVQPPVRSTQPDRTRRIHMTGPARGDDVGGSDRFFPRH